MMRNFGLATLVMSALLLQACSGGTDQSASSTTPPSMSGNTSSVASVATSSAMSTSSASSISSVASSTSSASSSITSSASQSSSSAAVSKATQLAIKLGKPARLLIGLGGYNETSNILSQSLQVDIYDRYLSEAGTPGSWPNWNAPTGDYVRVVAAAADSIGAIPMYTLYQMASNGDGNLSSLTNTTFMNVYWANVKLMFEKIAVYNKPALVNFEPDFWGYVERQGPSPDATTLSALITINPDCVTLTNNVKGIAGCLIAMARKYAPKAYVGFSPSDWGGDSTAQIVAFMNALGANAADFIVMQTLDRDAGCFEVIPQPTNCVRTGTGWYWDVNNVNHPNFTDHLTTARSYHDGIGGLPLIWWQTPMGKPSSTPGGTALHYRDNRTQYFLTHASELVAAGGLGVVFSGGELNQTNITSDGGQFQSLSSAYLTNPAPLN